MSAGVSTMSVELKDEASFKCLLVTYSEKGMPCTLYRLAIGKQYGTKATITLF